MKHKQLLVALVGLIALLLVTGSVYAEGGFTSYMYGVRVGFTSRTWTDKNLDNVSTSVTFGGCTKSVSIGLFRGATRVSGATFNCQNATLRASFGDLPAGDYKFKIERINGSTSTNNTVNVSYVGVAY